MTNREKFLALVAKEETKTVERAKVRLANKKYSKVSNLIAFEILERLDELCWKQKGLAEKMGVSPQQVNKWVKGNENFTIETLVSLGEVLGVELIQVVSASPAIQIPAHTKVYVSAAYHIIDNPTRVVPKITYSDNSSYENVYAIAN